MTYEERIAALKAEVNKIDKEVENTERYKNQLIARTNACLGKIELLVELQEEQKEPPAQKDENEVPGS